MINILVNPQEGHYHLLLDDIIRIQTLILIYLHTCLTLVSPLLCFMVAKRVAKFYKSVCCDKIKHRAMRFFSWSTQIWTDFRRFEMGISFGSKTCVYGEILE